ncbi:MAG: SGNH/GDSL hydrolase family protein [Balneolaceae bacterium]
MSITPRKKILFWLITILFPVVLLAIIELGLRLSGYDEKKQDLFIEYVANTDYLIPNPEYVKRYFPTFQPNIAPNVFKKEKAKNTFRVFVFGGSSTFGFPYNFYYSFASQLEQLLLLNTDGLNVEVINLGMTAVNSYVIRDLSKKVMPYDPDAVIIYAGHNEYYGSFGVATTQFGLVNSIFIKRMVIGLKDLRLFRLFENLLKGDVDSNPENRTLMAKVIKESNIELGGELYEEGVKQFEKNIGDVIDLFIGEEIPVYIGTIASNLKDQPPLGDNEDALSKYKEANRLLESGDSLSAINSFEEAKELDGIRFRGVKGINEFISKSSEREGVHLVDIQKMLRETSTSGIEDETIFTDHLHPNANGHILMAELFYETILDLKQVKDSYKPNSFTIPQKISQFEQVYSNTAISRLLVGYPFKKGLSVEQELAEFQKIYQGYLSSSYTDSIAASAARTNRLVPLALTDVVNKSKELQDSTMVISHYYELLKWQLNSVDLIEKGIEYAVNNRSADTYLVNIITQVLNDGNYEPRYMDVLSSLYLLNNELDKAGYWLAESERLEPDSMRLVYNYARYYLLTGNNTKANEYYQRFLNLQKGN